MSTTFPRLKLTDLISIIPKNEQKKYKTALTTNTFTSEIIIPKKLNNRRTIEGKNYFRNILIHFNNNFNKGQSQISSINKHTTEFSKNYDSIINDNTGGKQVTRHLDTYCELIAKYTTRGYDKNNLFPESNIFQPSLLLEDSSLYEKVHVIGDPVENENDQTYMNNTTVFIQGRKQNGIARSVGINSNKYQQPKQKIMLASSNTLEYESPYKKRPTIKKSRNDFKLLPGINQMNSKSMRVENARMRANNKRLQECVNNIDKEYYIENTDANTMNSTAMQTASIKGEKMRIENMFVSSKGMMRSATKRKSDKDDDNENKNNASNNNEVKVGRRKQSVIAQYKLHRPKQKRTMFSLNGNSTELEKLYEKTVTSQYHKSKNAIVSYLKKNNKRLPEEPDSEKGANLKGFTSEFEKRTIRRNLPDLLHQMKVRMGDYSQKDNQIDTIRDLDKSIRALEFDYVDDILKVNRF